MVLLHIYFLSLHSFSGRPNEHYMQISVLEMSVSWKNRLYFKATRKRPGPQLQTGGGGAHNYTSIRQGLSQESRQFLLIPHHLISFLFRLKLKSRIEDAHDISVIQIRLFQERGHLELNY